MDTQHLYTIDKGKKKNLYLFLEGSKSSVHETCQETAIKKLFSTQDLALSLKISLHTNVKNSEASPQYSQVNVLKFTRLQEQFLRAKK